MLIPSLYVTSLRTPSLRPVRVPSNQNTRWRLPIHIFTGRDKNFLVSPPLFSRNKYSDFSLRVDDRRAAAHVQQGVSVFFFCVHIIIINWIFIPLHVCFLDIVPRILVINVLTLHLTIFIFPVMSASMNMCYHLIILNRLQRSPPQPPPHPLLSPS